MTTLAVLSGGQLGRMLGLAGIPLGIEFRFLDPSPDASAGAVGQLVTGAFDDRAAVDELVASATVCTFEWEGVPASTAAHVAARIPVYPPPRALEVSQDRLVEKELLRGLGIGVPEFARVDDEVTLRHAVDAIGLPAVLKTRRGGYDGKGQVVLRTPADGDGAFAAIGGHPAILEAFVPFDRELSVLAVRDRHGDVRVWPLVHNEHRDGILRVSRAAPVVSDTTRAQAESHIVKLLDALDYVGVLALECFDVRGELLGNEIAPRVHNSGHWTIEGAVTSQFENHVRAVLGLPLGATDARGASAMVNCIGAMPDRDAVLAIPGTHWHDYGKEPRRARKVGHITVTAPTADDVERTLEALVPLVAASEAG